MRLAKQVKSPSEKRGAYKDCKLDFDEKVC